METKDWLEGYDPVAAGEQDENGIDLEALRYNLSLSPEQRWSNYAAAANQMLKLIDAAERSGLRPRRAGT